jgi:hypothetical protein
VSGSVAVPGTVARHYIEIKNRGAQRVSPGVETKITFAEKSYGQGMLYDAPNDRVVAQNSGMYMVNIRISVLFESRIRSSYPDVMMTLGILRPSDGPNKIELLKGGVFSSAGSAPSASGEITSGFLSLQTMINLKSGDSFDARLLHRNADMRAAVINASLDSPSVITVFLAVPTI